MKILFSTVSLLLFFVIFPENISAQHRKITVILLRHAEKDTSPTADKTNPNLSEEGKLRAQKLVKVINKYKPDAIFSTDFIRTRMTVAPLSEKRKISVQIYDLRNLKELADLILSGKIKRLVVVGHNSTTPALVNLLIGQEKYQTLPETEYSKIWILKIKRNKTKPNKIKEKIIIY